LFSKFIGGVKRFFLDQLGGLEVQKLNILFKLIYGGHGGVHSSRWG